MWDWEQTLSGAPHGQMGCWADELALASFDWLESGSSWTERSCGGHTQLPAEHVLMASWGAYRLVTSSLIVSIRAMPAVASGTELTGVGWRVMAFPPLSGYATSFYACPLLLDLAANSPGLHADVTLVDGVSVKLA